MVRPYDAKSLYVSRDILILFLDTYWARPTLHRLMFCQQVYGKLDIFMKY